MTEDEIKERLKHLSIKARVAYGTTILEDFAKKLDIFYQPRIQRLIDAIWEMMPSASHWWYVKIGDYRPSLVSDSCEEQDFSENFVMLPEEMKEYNKLYQSLPKDFLELVESVILCGQTHFYGAVPFDENGLKLYFELEFFNIANRNQLSLPDIKRFEISTVHDNPEIHGVPGFGRELYRSDFQEK